MKFFQKTWVAVLITVIMIAAAVGIGQYRGSVSTPAASDGRLDTTLNTQVYLNDWISDQAGVLSQDAKEQIALYNANWVQRYDSLIAVATLPSIDGSISDYAYDLGTQIQLASADGILVVDVADKDCYLAVGPDYPLSDSQITEYLDQYLYADAMAGDYSQGIVSLFHALNQYYLDSFGVGNLSQSVSTFSQSALLVNVVMLDNEYRSVKDIVSRNVCQPDFKVIPLDDSDFSFLISITFLPCKDKHIGRKTDYQNY